MLFGKTMASILPGYEYDIFISYRQKDNKYDGWVTEFVDHLKKELEATFKEDINLYFDINPHDGLLETHDVDESLKSKLKCLVFIPVISRTYCDPKSFAWEHEFRAFVEQASQDQLGLKVKLSSGNVASRVLPVRIHELDTPDIRECESVLGGVLRGIEFIYKEPGVNRPLTPDDDEKINLNKTKYRNQINKVANAVREIIMTVQTGPGEPLKTKTDSTKIPGITNKNLIRTETVKPGKGIKRKSLYWIIGMVVLVAVFTAIAYPKVFRRDTLDSLRSKDGRISIAVMPFQNMTNDKSISIWQYGIQDKLIGHLSNLKELKVRQRESIISLIRDEDLANPTSITPFVAGKISRKLDANVFLTGGFMQTGSDIHITAKINDAKTEEVVKSFELEGRFSEETIWNLGDSLARLAGNFLVVTVLKKELNPEFQEVEITNSPEAYKFFVTGTNAFYSYNFSMAVSSFEQAIKIDPAYGFARIMLSMAYRYLGQYGEAKKICLEGFKNKDQFTWQTQNWINWLHAFLFESPDKEIEYLRNLIEIDDQLPHLLLYLGRAYSDIYQYKNAIPEFEKAIEIYKRWNLKPVTPACYSWLGDAYHQTGHFKKESKLYKKMEVDYPDEPELFLRRAILALMDRDTSSANRLIEKFRSITGGHLWSASRIAANMAFVYSEAGIMDKAEEHYRKALAMEPDNPLRMNNLAYFLVDHERGVQEGLNLADKALSIIPDDYEYLDTKGWGLYKQGKYQQALKALQNSWDIRKEKAIYDHTAWLHLQEAKKAVQTGIPGH